MKTLETAHERIVAVPADPQRDFRSKLYGVLFILACSILGYIVTSVVTGSYQKKLAKKNEELSYQVSVFEQSEEDLRRELATAKTGAAIDRASAEEVRAALRDSQNKVAKLTEDLQFYKNLMDPKAGESGLDAYQFHVFSTSDETLYRYRLTLQQLGTKQKTIGVNVKAAVSGISEGELVLLQLSNLVHDSTPWSDDVKFRYYANIDGMFRLPEGFTPDGIEVSLTQKSKPTKTFQFNWQVLENNLYVR